MVKANDVRRARSSGGVTADLIPDASGPPTTTYHDPKTGQEFHGLPMDRWSMEIYMKGGRHGSRPRLFPGPAPAELRAQWLASQADRKDPADAPEIQAEAAKMIGDFEDGVLKKIDQSLLGLVEKLSKQVADLTARLDGGAAIQPAAPTEPEPAEPRQLEMSLGV